MEVDVAAVGGDPGGVLRTAGRWRQWRELAITGGRSGGAGECPQAGIDELGGAADVGGHALVKQRRGGRG
jgi:hypothetical protein